MLIVIEKKKGKVINPQQYIPCLDKLDDGKYLVTIKQLREDKTEEEYRAQYFSLVDTVRDYTGDSRNTIHARAKALVNLETTKDFDISDWVSFIKIFKDEMFLKLDLIL